MSPIGILGGTFDPIHFGHLRLAQEVGEQLRLAEVRFIPSGTPPHRAAPVASAADRLAMVKLAVAGNPLFTVDGREAAHIRVHKCLTTGLTRSVEPHDRFWKALTYGDNEYARQIECGERHVA